MKNNREAVDSSSLKNLLFYYLTDEEVAVLIRKKEARECPAYDIIDSETGNVVKTGVSGGKVRGDGKSYRAEQQVRKWNAEAGSSKYESVITHTEPEGVGARDRILDYEKRRADHLRQHNQLDKYKHIRP